MKLKLFDYNLPKNLIAQKPANPRDSSRLFVYDKKNKKIEHKIFRQIGDYLKPGDVLVFNDSKVFPARLIGKKAVTGGRMEIFLLNEKKMGEWEVLIKGRGKKDGLIVNFSNKLKCELIKKIGEFTWLVKFNKKGESLKRLIMKFGKTPIPPYIKNSLKETVLRKRYQTVYAKKIGSVAAPTAGFHFTKRLLKQLNKKGVQCEFVTLHVGLGTFQLVNVENIEDYKIHSETVIVKTEVAKRLLEAKKQRRRIIAVGTTSARTLEAIFSKKKFKINSSNIIKKNVDLFIYPGYKFKMIDGLITNFHLPKSTLLMLISAFIGRKKTLELYQIAIKKGYRFYSFGDVMFLF